MEHRCYLGYGLSLPPSMQVEYSNSQWLALKAFSTHTCWKIALPTYAIKHAASTLLSLSHMTQSRKDRITSNRIETICTRGDSGLLTFGQKYADCRQI